MMSAVNRGPLKHWRLLGAGQKMHLVRWGHTGSRDRHWADLRELTQSSKKPVHTRLTLIQVIRALIKLGAWLWIVF